MARPHLAPGAVGSVRPLGPKLAQTESHALFKSSQLQVMRLVLLAGKTLPRHQVPGQITIQCLEGVVELEAGGHRSAMQAGDFLYLDADVPHEIRARQDASLLVTVWLPPAA